MLDRNRVLARPVEPSEPTLTLGMVMDCASYVSHAVGPCTRFQFDDFATAWLVPVWTRPERRQRHVDQDITVDAVRTWLHVASGLGEIDPGKFSTHLKVNVRQFRGKWVGPAFYRWAYQVRQPHLKELSHEGPHRLTKQAAVAIGEAAVMTKAALLDRVAQPVAPPEAMLEPVVEWLTTYWEPLTKDGFAQDIINAPWWWFQTWARGAPLDFDFASRHPALLQIAASAFPDFQQWWPLEVARVAAARRAEEVARARAEAEQYRREAAAYAHARRAPARPGLPRNAAVGMNASGLQNPGGYASGGYSGSTFIAGFGAHSPYDSRRWGLNW
ncbi:hypothetical protein HP550_17575 [Cellulomonas humilata]|uniref:Uncharacterized protein n=1 Tax=Cellulomonas humilata TaxID=144055 RepID=A0A7Y6A3J1_9CELL|nr:hypothetical protein [Cellulomonas humilata]NUU19062.1 hypothetical protein [Cellulomonas humilata]